MDRIVPARRPLVLLLGLALSGLVIPASPAEAALPSSTPTEKLRCANGKKAKAWVKFKSDAWEEVKRIAVDNRCKKEWVEVSFRFPSESSPSGRSLMVAPGQKLDWDRAALTEWGLQRYDTFDFEAGGISLVDKQRACVANYWTDTSGMTRFEGILFFRADKVRAAPECGEPVPEYSPNRYAELRCPDNEGTARLAWKTKGKKIVKVALSGCRSGEGSESEYSAVAWWKLKNGRTVGLWVDPEEPSIDIWKSEFGDLPVKSKDGKVRLSTSPWADQEDRFRSKPKDRPFYYNGFVRNGEVDCTAGQKSC